MLLEGKNAVIYGAGGPVGGVVALAFARAGASVHVGPSDVRTRRPAGRPSASAAE